MSSSTPTKNMLVRAAAVAVMIPMLVSLKATDAAAVSIPTDTVLRVYNNNIENLITNNSDGSCTRVSAVTHLNSILTRDLDPATGANLGTYAPDILIVQQVRGDGQITAYADQISDALGMPGAYKALVVWQDPEPWGATHHCDDQSLGDLKKKQTNGIIYNSRRLTLLDTSTYWSAGWLKPGTSYDNGNGCTLYKPPNNDDGSTNEYKWKRTSAIAAQFTFKPTGAKVFAATMHLPEQNGANACAGDNTKGIAGSGIRIGSSSAITMLNASSIRLIGIDANRSGISSTALSADYGVTGYGTGATMGTSKIDYLFVKGTVRQSGTVSGTRSNHKALYTFIK